MPENRSDASRFISKHGGGYVSNHQYLTECLCVLIARQQKKQLGDNFWKHEPWASVFRNQAPSAAALLKEYNVNVILAALRDRRCWKISSFRARSMLDPILKEKNKEYQAKNNAVSTEMIKTETVQQPRVRVGGKKSLLTLLKEVE